MPTKPAAPADDESRGTSERSYQDLARKIIELAHSDNDRDTAAEQRLPSERTLAEMFSVSRTAVREAIIALEVQGLVEVKVGSGIYVLPPGSQAAHGFEISGGPGPIETLRARALIESEIASVAARERRDSDLDRLFETLADMRKHLADKAPYDAADRQFHLAIAEATGNRVLQHMVQAMWDNARSDPRWDKIEQHFHSQALRETSLNDHQAIFAAISARDAEGARAAMQQHLGRVIQEFSQAWR